MSQGKAKKLCGAKKRAANGTCGKPAGWGTPNDTGPCKLHGGLTPNHLKAAEKEKANRALVTYGLPREIDPHTALIEELHRTAGHVAYLQQIVAELTHDSDKVGESELKQYQVGENGVIERPAVWIEMYHQERKHFARVAKDCISAGIEERRVRIAEEQGQMFAKTMRAILEDLGHDPTDKRVRDTMGRHLRAV